MMNVCEISIKNNILPGNALVNRMRSLDELRKEAAEIQLKIRKLLLNNYSYDDGIADQLTKIATITDLRNRFIALEREIRLRTDAGE
jgi:hypothetical protein